MNIYLSASIKNIPRTIALAEVLETNGHLVTCKWWEYTLEDGSITWGQLAQLELDAVLGSDALIFLPGGKGSHFELGVAYAMGIDIYGVEKCEGWDSSLFHALPNIQRLPFEEIMNHINIEPENE